MTDIIKGLVEVDEAHEYVATSGSEVIHSYFSFTFAVIVTVTFHLLSVNVQLELHCQLTFADHCEQSSVELCRKFFAQFAEDMLLQVQEHTIYFGIRQISTNTEVPLTQTHELTLVTLFE